MPEREDEKVEGVWDCVGQGADVTEVNQMRTSGTVRAERLRSFCGDGFGWTAISVVL